jgi:hypothetical protein
MAQMLWMTSTWIPDNWILHPQFQLWPPKRCNANVLHLNPTTVASNFTQLYGLPEAVKMESTVLEEGEGMYRELPCSHGPGHGTNPYLCWCKGMRMENQGSRRNRLFLKEHRQNNAIIITQKITKSVSNVDTIQCKQRMCTINEATTLSHTARQSD